MRSVIQAMSEEELRDVARLFLDTDKGGPSYRTSLQARDGVLCATNGYMHIRIESPAVKAIEGSAENVLDLQPAPSVRIAWRHWVMGDLAATVAKAQAKDAKRIGEQRADFIAEVNARSRHCPCCGARLAVEYGDLEDLETYIADYTPDEANSGAAVFLHVPWRGTRKIRLYNLYRALLAAEKLGGDAELCVDDGWQNILRGEDWTIIVLSMRLDSPDTEHDIDLHVPATDDGRAAP